MPQKSEQRLSKLAIVSLICGLLGLVNLSLNLLSLTGVTSLAFHLPRVFAFVILGFFGFPPTLYLFITLAFIFGIIALVKIRNNPNLKGKTLALVGTIVGGLMVLIHLYGIFFGKIEAL